METTTEFVNVRVSAREHELLHKAAASVGLSVAHFVRYSAVNAAAHWVLDRRNVVLPVKSWDEIDAYLAAPAKQKPELQTLANRKTAWQD